METKRYHSEHGVKHLVNRWLGISEDGSQEWCEEIAPNVYEWNPPEIPKGDNRLVDFSLFAGGEVGLGLYEALIQSDRVAGRGHLTAMERMTVEDTVERGGSLFRAIPDVTDKAWFLQVGALRKRFAGCQDIERLMDDLAVIGVPDVKTLDALSLKGDAYVHNIAEALREVTATGEPTESADSLLYGEDTAPMVPMFERYIRVSHHADDTAHDKGLPNPAWWSGYKTAKDLQAVSFADLSAKQKAFRAWYESRKGRQGFPSVAKAFWESYRFEFARLSADAFSGEVIAWVARIMTIPADKLKLAGAHIGSAGKAGRFTPDQVAVLWRAWHKRRSQVQ